jgi:hypothetical protein
VIIIIGNNNNVRFGSEWIGTFFFQDRRCHFFICRLWKGLDSFFLLEIYVWCRCVSYVYYTTSLPWGFLLYAGSTVGMDLSRPPLVMNNDMSIAICSAEQVHSRFSLQTE